MSEAADKLFPVKKKGGAPLGNTNSKKKEPRNQLISIYLSKRERGVFTRRAAKMGLTLNKYFRLRLKLDKEVF